MLYEWINGGEVKRGSNAHLDGNLTTEGTATIGEMLWYRASYTPGSMSRTAHHRGLETVIIQYTLRWAMCAATEHGIQDATPVLSNIRD